MGTDDLSTLLGYAAQYAGAHIARAPMASVKVTASVEELRQAFGGPLPPQGEDALEVLATLTDHGEPGLMPTTSGRFFGYVMGGAQPVAVAADWITSLWDQGGTMFEINPLTAVMEETCTQWLVEMFDLPAETSVGVTSG